MCGGLRVEDYPRERIHLRHRIFAHALRRRRPLCASRRRTRPTGGRARPPTRVAVVPCSAMWSIAPQWVPVPVRPDRHQNVTCTAARPTRPPLLQMVLRRRRRVHPQWAHRQWVQRRPLCNVVRWWLDACKHVSFAAAAAVPLVPSRGRRRRSSARAHWESVCRREARASRRIFAPWVLTHLHGLGTWTGAPYV